jgi:hypothetical protein
MDQAIGKLALAAATRNLMMLYGELMRNRCHKMESGRANDDYYQHVVALCGYTT